MSKETSVITRSFYAIALDSESLPEVRSKMRRIMDEEDIAIVEREVARWKAEHEK